MTDLPAYSQLAARRSRFLEEVIKVAKPGKNCGWFHLAFDNPPPDVSGLWPDSIRTRAKTSPTRTPNFGLPENESVGLNLDVVASEGKWRAGRMALNYSVGYALGAAQKFTRLQDILNVQIFLRLADLEERAWKIVSKGQTEEIDWRGPDGRRDHASDISRSIVNCCVYAGNNSEKFAYYLSCAYESTLNLVDAPMQKARIGRRPIPGVEAIINHLSRFSKFERDSSLKEIEGTLWKYADKTKISVIVTDGKGNWTDEKRTYKTLEACWTKAQKRRARTT